MTASTWMAPLSRRVQLEEGRDARRRTPRRALAELQTGDRDPLGILEAQNATRVPELVPLRRERMAASPFAFYRGSAAIMAADLAQGPSSGIRVASCGDAHVSNFGFYASPQRSLVFDLNDFDEAAWAPWEWDLKRLVTSMVVAGQSAGRDDAVIRDAAWQSALAYAQAMTAALERSPLERYFTHYDAADAASVMGTAAGTVISDAIRHATRRTGERAARKLTEADADGRLRFTENPPTTTHIDAELAGRVEGSVTAYLETADAGIRMLLSRYEASDTVRRVVGVGSVGTRCYLTSLQDGDGHVILLQTKEAVPSVLVQHGGCRQPSPLTEHIAASGEGARVVSLQRVLQGVSDPFLCYLRGTQGDYYVRQFRDMKGGIDAETLEDDAFATYGRACAAVLARAHSQSPALAVVAGYLGPGRAVADAIVEWAYAYAKLSLADHAAFAAA